MKPYTCGGCPLYSHGVDFSSVEGTGRLGLMVVAEASGEGEARDGLPLRPWCPAGSIFERTLRRLEIDRQDLLVTNMLRCRPRSNLLTGMSYESAAIQYCKPNLEAAYLNPSKPQIKVILAMGAIPFSYLTGLGGPDMRLSLMRGYLYKLDSGYSQKLAEDADINNVVVLPTYHPSHIRRGATELFGVFARDVMRAVKIARGEDFGYIVDDPLMAIYRDELQYELQPSVYLLQQFYEECRDNPDLPIVFDLETSESPSLDEDARDQFSDTKIRQIQFSIRHAQAIAVPWKPEFMALIGAILGLPNDKVGHNCYNFDCRVMRAAAPEIFIAGKIHDTLLMWRRWQPELPGNLQYVASFVQFPFAWKHLSTTNLPFYGCCDVDSDGRIFRMLKESMTKLGMWEQYEQQIVDIRELPALVARNSIKVSQEVGIEISTQLTADQEKLSEEMNQIYPSELRTFEPEEGYKKAPKAVEERIKAWNFERAGMLMGEPTVLDGESLNDYVLRHTGCIERVFMAKVKNIATLIMEPKPIDRWCKAKAFLPNSRPQIIRYAKFKKHEIPKTKDKAGGDRDSLTLEDIDLMYGRTKDPMYRMIGKYRRMSEDKRSITELQIESNIFRGMVHPMFKIDPEGGVMSSSSPPLPSEYSIVAKALVPNDGAVFVRWRWECQRERILQSLAGTKEPFSIDPDKIHPAAMRGFLIGESDRTILDANRIVFGTSLKTIMNMRVKFNLQWPEVIRWQNGMRNKAHQQNFLVNRFGEIRWFYEVYRPDGRGGMTDGDQAVAASRFLPETEAAGAMRWRMGVMREVIARYRLVAFARDWMVFEVPGDSLSGHLRAAYKLASMSPPQLGGLELPVIAEGGYNLKEFTAINIVRS